MRDFRGRNEKICKRISFGKSSGMHGQPVRVMIFGIPTKCRQAVGSRNRSGMMKQWWLLRIFGICACSKQNSIQKPALTTTSALEQPQSFNGTTTSPTICCKSIMKLPQIGRVNKHELRNSPFKDLPLELHLQILSLVDLRDIIAYRKVVILFPTSLTLLTNAA